MEKNGHLAHWLSVPIVRHLITGPTYFLPAPKIKQWILVGKCKLFYKFVPIGALDCIDRPQVYFLICAAGILLIYICCAEPFLFPILFLSTACGRDAQWEWKKKYGVYQEKVDSISGYWKVYKEENTLEQWARVELARIHKVYHPDSGDIGKVYLGFRLTPLQGRIDRLQFSFGIGAKSCERDRGGPYPPTYVRPNRLSCLTTDPFSRPIVGYWEANATDSKILKGKTLGTFHRDYDISIGIDEIWVNGKNRGNDSVDIPGSIEGYWRYGEFYTSQVVGEVLGEAYVDRYDYLNQEIDKILRESDSLAFDFLRLSRTMEGVRSRPRLGYHSD